jgi:Zn-dependent oligopeptidase
MPSLLVARRWLALLTHRAAIILDLFTRPHKQPSCCTFAINYQLARPTASCNVNSSSSCSSSSSTHVPEEHLAHAVIACDFSTFGVEEARTLFHEFGHALHILLSRTELQLLTGARSSRDFTEVPSTLFERFLTDYNVVSLFARNSCGQVIPKQVFDAWIARSVTFTGLDTQYQIALARIDQVCHRVNSAACTKLLC